VANVVLWIAPRPFDGGSWNVKTNETPTEAADAGRRDAEIDELIAWLDTCRAALDAHGLTVLDEVFATFMDRHYDKVRRRARQWGVPTHEARDFVQEVFFAFHGRVRDHGVKRSLLTTLHIVTRGKLLQDARDRRGVPESVCLPSSGSLPESSVDVERAIDRRTLARKFVHELPEKHQAVVNKMLLEDKTAAEAAEELGLPEGTVKTRLRAAVRLLYARAAPWLPQSQRKA
jgi:RNA polymerase sigma-70 factor (ECF subfamily)